MRANHIIAQAFKEQMFALIAIYADATGKKIKATLMRTKLNMDTATVLCKVRQYVVRYRSYIDSGDIDAFLQQDYASFPHAGNIQKLLKIISTIRANVADISALLEIIRNIRDACVEYVDT